MKYVVLTVLGIVLCSEMLYSAALNTLYSDNTKITIKKTIVSGTGTINNFVLLLDIGANAALTTTGPGKIRSNGFDIVFAPAQNSDESVAYKHYLEHYNATTGELVVWIQLTLSATVNTELYMFYGRPGMADPSDGSVWTDANYIGVWQLSENPGAGTVVDASGTSANGSSFNNVAIDNNGVVYRGYTFDGNGDYVTIPTTNAIEPAGSFTISCWFRSDGGQTGWAKMFAKGRLNNPYSSYTLEMRPNVANTSNDREIGFQTGRMNGNYINTESNVNGVDDIEDNTWYYFVGVLEAASGTYHQHLYLDGELITSITNASAVNYYTGDGGNYPYPLTIGGLFTAGGINNEFRGSIDELRISNTARSADYINTDRNNLVCGAAFISLDNGLPVNCRFPGVLPVELLSFSARRVHQQVDLTWVTTAEKNNDYFTVERSRNGSVFEAIEQVSGAGNSNTEKTYTYTDTYPGDQKLYYRIKQTDYDGRFSYSKPVYVAPVSADTPYKLNLFPNPNHGSFSLTIPNAEYAWTVSILDLTGKPLKTFSLDRGSERKKLITVNNLSSGVYYVKAESANGVLVEKMVIH